METHFPNIQAAYGAVTRDRVVADLQGLIRNAEALLRATGRAEETEESRAQLAQAIERARATCAQLQREGWMGWRAAAAKTDAVIRQHPYPALGIAFGLGAWIGWLAARR